MEDNCHENKHYLKLSRFSRETNHILSLNIFYININRLKNKTERLEYLLHSLQQQIDVIILSETFLFQSECNFINLPNYYVFHNTRESRDGGGISVFVHNTIDFQLVHQEVTLENEFVIIHSKSLNVTLICVYKPPHTSTSEFLIILDRITSKYKNLIIVGDCNLNLMNETDSQICNYKSLLQINGLNIINKLSKAYATRIQGNSCSIIDHLLSSFKNTFYILYGDVDLSDHRYILIKYVLSKKTVNVTYTKMTVNHDGIIEWFLNKPSVPYGDFESFYESLAYSIKNSVKFTTVNIKTNSYKKPWFNEELKKLANSRNKFYKLHKKYPNNNFFLTSLKKSQTVFHSRIIFYKKLYFTQKFKKNMKQPKNMWRLINQILTNSCDPKSKTIELRIQNTLTTDALTVANQFVEFFSNVSVSITGNYPSNFRYYESPQDLKCASQTLLPTDEEEIQRIIDNLATNSSMGYDYLNARHIKKLKSIITPLLTKSINKWMGENYFPSFMKIARITPIYKNGDRCLAENYRPISVLPIFSKVFERVIYTRMVDYLQIQNIIHKNQFGFCKAKSTVSAALNLVENLYGHIEKQNTTACMFLDLMKAFDCVDHSILLRKLSFYGFHSNVVSLIKSYLSDRLQFVKIANCASNKLSLNCGVPQGSILGPILFLVYINNIFEVKLHGQIQLFADDIAIVYGCINSVELKRQMELDLQIISNWLYNNKLKLNCHKSNFIVFYLRKEPLDLFDEITGQSICIKRTQEATYLGLNINSQLTWTSHINSIKKKISPFIGALRRTARFIPQDLSLNLYFSYIHSHLIYLAQIWGSASLYVVNDLQILQNKSIKALKNLPPLTPSKLLYSDQILPITKLIEFEYIMTVYKIKLGTLKCNVDLKTNLQLTERITRASHNYRLPNYKLSLTQNSIFYKGIDLFNQLKESQKCLHVVSFKSSIKNQLYNKYIEEYDLFHN